MKGRGRAKRGRGAHLPRWGKFASFGGTHPSPPSEPIFFLALKIEAEGRSLSKVLFYHGKKMLTCNFFALPGFFIYNEQDSKIATRRKRNRKKVFSGYL
jgi:hypothetical protein